MKISPKKLNAYLLFKLPSAYLTGVRTKFIDNEKCVVTVKHRWINQNPFKSMFWAVQGMAAELTTGALVMQEIKASGKNISMLLVSNNATFVKKATGRISFVCNEGVQIADVVKKAIDTREGQTIWLHVNGTNKEGVIVSSFKFEWGLKLKS